LNLNFGCLKPEGSQKIFHGADNLVEVGSLPIRESGLDAAERMADFLLGRWRVCPR
jgi:hypothetical protein